jgi:cytochrome P450
MVNEPELLPTAIEELLRMYAPVTMARIVSQDAEIGGCPVKRGDSVLLPFPSGKPRPRSFPRCRQGHY